MNIKYIKKYFPSNKHFYVTKEGLDGLRAQLDQLRKERHDVCNRLIGMDPKEKNDHILANDVIKMLEINEDDVMKIADVLQHAEVVAKTESTTDVKVGSTVDLQFEHQTLKYTLVSTIEADPSKNKISENSPLGKALLGKKEHETVAITTPKGARRFYRVVTVS